MKTSTLKSIFTAFLITMPLLMNAQTVDNDTIKDEEKIYSTVGLTKLPEYPGGLNAFFQYVSRNFNVPAAVNEDINVKVLTTFVIEKDGTLSGIEVLRDPGYGLADEAKRLLMAVPEKWSPGIMDGEPVRVKYTLPIHVTYKADKPKEKE